MEQTVGGKRQLLFLAGILAIAGLVITFTQSLHDNPTFNAWLIVAFAALLAIDSITRWVSAKNSPTRFVLLIQALTSVALAIYVGAMRDEKSIRLGLVIWAAVSVASFVYAWVLTKNKQLLALAVFGTLFVLALSFLARDLAGTVGFFAAFSIMLGVYLAITAFDPNKNLQESTEKTGISI